MVINITLSELELKDLQNILCDTYITPGLVFE